MLRKNLFYIVWFAVVLIVGVMSTVYRDGREAMVAQVESRVATVSLPVVARIDSIYVIPGQSVRRGDALVKISRPDLDLEIRKAQYGLQLSRMDSLHKVQQYERQQSKLRLDYQQQEQTLLAKRKTKALEIAALKSKQQLLTKLSSKGVEADLDALNLEIALIDEQLTKIRIGWQIERTQLRKLFETQQQLMMVQIKEELLKLEELRLEKAELTQYAPFDGTVGPINVELQEITEAHDKLVSIFESSPSLIKAYTKENQTATLSIGQGVKVTATNRSYEINGVIESMGSRVTSYPAKINPNPNGQSYGQEVFIRINPDNRFLEGEKVYVYAVED
jgi:multidrug resistance efflux pump